MFEPHCGLSLERDGPRESNEGSHRIDQSPRRRRGEHTHAALQHRARLLVNTREAERWPSEVAPTFELLQKACGGANGMTSGRISACKERLPQMSNPPKALTHAAHEKFPAPNASVVTEARAIECDAEHALIEGTALGQHAGHVGTMVLDGNHAVRIDFECVSGRGVFRMEIVNDGQLIWPNRVHREQILDDFLKRTPRRQ